MNDLTPAEINTLRAALADAIEFRAAQAGDIAQGISGGPSYVDAAAADAASARTAGKLTARVAAYAALLHKLNS